jgi:hypothetical protein
MSNIMHKVKDAVTGHHDKETSRAVKTSNNVDDTRDTYGSSNPQNKVPSSSDTYGSGRQTGNRPDFQRDENRDTRSTNAGPHDSNLTNKMDPRVDSDLDNRGQYAGNTGQSTGQSTGPQSTGFQMSGDNSYGANPSNMASDRQPRGVGNMTSEESYSTSSKEHESHSTTSQTTSQMNPNAMSGLGSGTGQQDLGGGQQGFGGGAAGGSSNNNFGTRGSGMQDSDPLNKLDPRVRGSNEQQSTMGNQRGGY